MKIITKSWIKTLSSPFALDDNNQLTIPGLILLGVIASVLYTHVRYPLNIPGHHGLEWMAFVMFGRCLSTHRNAATIIASGAAIGYLLQSPLFAFTYEIKPLIVFFMTGFVSDRIYFALKNNLPVFIAVALTGALAFTSKALYMYVTYLFTDIKVGAFLKHPDYLPFISHFMFGLLGAVGGLMLANLATNSHRN